MHWPAIIVVALLIGYILSETVSATVREGFTTPLRADIGYAADGWGEDSGYVRDLRYTEAFVDLQGLGIATDFCRAVAKKSDPESLRISCALGRHDGMDTMEYNTKSKREGFRFSRDDYWRKGVTGNGRMDYCRILKDETTGEHYSGCAVASYNGFKPREERDTEPPLAILELLEAYEGILTWFRWRDDREDYAEVAVTQVFGRPVFPTALKPTVSRGLQLNRWSAASQAAGEPAPPLRDYLRWGERGTLELHQAIQPRQIRAIAFWVWWDGFEKGAAIIDCGNPAKHVRVQDRIVLGVEGGGLELPPLSPKTMAAQEVRSEVVHAIGPVTQPSLLVKPIPLSKESRYYFEIWDEESRIMRLNAPMASARTNEWQHVAVTTTDATAWWPTWQLWINGALVAEKTDGRLSPAMEITENFIGKNVRGCIQDFRVYSTPLTEDKLRSAIRYSKDRLHPTP